MLEFGERTLFDCYFEGFYDAAVSAVGCWSGRMEVEGGSTLVDDCFHGLSLRHVESDCYLNFQQWGLKLQLWISRDIGEVDASVCLSVCLSAYLSHDQFLVMLKYSPCFVDFTFK